TERRGGSIPLDSAPGAGSTFAVTVPLPRAGASEAAGYAPPALAGSDVLIIAPTAIEAPLVARRLTHWGARTCLAPDPEVAAALIPERTWGAVLVDYALGDEACARLVQATAAIARRSVLITPAGRHALAALRAAGFTGYLVKPVRAASLAARMGAAADAFERGSGDTGAADDAGDAAAAAPARAGQALAILVAEDNEINALLAKSLLQRLGHRPTLAASRDEAGGAVEAAEAGG